MGFGELIIEIADGSQTLCAHIQDLSLTSGVMLENYVTPLSLGLLACKVEASLLTLGSCEDLKCQPYRDLPKKNLSKELINSDYVSDGQDCFQTRF